MTELSQHREQVEREHEMLADLASQIRSSSGRSDFRTAARLLVELQALEEAHYAAEEAALRDSGSSMPEKHRIQHAGLLDVLRSINHDIRSGDSRTVSPLIAAHLEAALAHMHEEDRALWAGIVPTLVAHP